MAAPAHRQKPKRESHLVLYLAYSNCIQAIKHFENVQTTFRVMTSTILLATFVGIGFIFSGENRQLPIDSFIAVAIVCSIGIAGIYALWHLDLIFYERLLTSFFAEAYDIEDRSNWLPKIHHKMVAGRLGEDKAKNLVFFYIGCGSTLIVTAGLVGTYLLEPYGALAMAGAIGGTILLLLFYRIHLRRRTENQEQLLFKLLAKKKDNGSS